MVPRTHPPFSYFFYLRYKLFKVRPDKLSILQNWAEELKKREAEVLATLEYENVSMETMYLFSVGDEWFVMGMQDIVGEHRKADMTVELNQRHFAVLKECLEPHEGAVLYQFER